MLEKHPQGREFEEVRFLTRQIRSYRPDKDVVPIEEADPKETPIGKKNKNNRRKTIGKSIGKAVGNINGKNQ